MSSDDADDERKSPAPSSIVDWTDSKSLKFSLFVLLPNGDVCLLRSLPSGISTIELKCRLELFAGIPSHVYKLMYLDGEELSDDQRLMVKNDILHGYLLRVTLHENWEPLYSAVTKNNIEQVYHSGGVHLKGNITISANEADRCERVVSERGAVALFIAAYLGLQRMVSMLLSVGVDVNSSTRFGRSPLHAAVAKDHVTIVEMLINQGAALLQTDRFKCTALDVARQMSADLCLRKLRLKQFSLYENTANVKRSRSRISLDLTSNSPINGVGKDDLQRTRMQSSFYPDVSAAKTMSSIKSLHASRKHASSSAPAQDCTIKSNIRREVKSVTSHNENGTPDVSKASVKWKDIAGNSNSCQTFKLEKKQIGDVISEISNVLSTNYTDHRKILKFIGHRADFPTVGKPDISDPAACKKAEETNCKEHKNVEVMRLSRDRLRYFQGLSRKGDACTPMVTGTKCKKDRPCVSEAYKQWLEQKNIEMEEPSSNVAVNKNDSEEDEFEKLSERVLETDCREITCLVPGNKPVNDVTTIGSTQFESRRHSPSEHKTSLYHGWRRKKRGYLLNLPKRKTVNDFIQEKKRLEVKRQKLLMNAIAFNEWMSHTEERKSLIKHILQADYYEIQRIEEEHLNGKRGLNSYDIWKDKLLQRVLEEKQRKSMLKQYEQEIMKEKQQLQLKSSTMPFDKSLRHMQRRRINDVLDSRLCGKGHPQMVRQKEGCNA